MSGGSDVAYHRPNTAQDGSRKPACSLSQSNYNEAMKLQSNPTAGVRRKSRASRKELPVEQTSRHGQHPKAAMTLETELATG